MLSTLVLNSDSDFKSVDPPRLSYEGPIKIRGNGPIVKAPAFIYGTDDVGFAYAFSAKRFKDSKKVNLEKEKSMEEHMLRMMDLHKTDPNRQKVHREFLNEMGRIDFPNMPEFYR